MKRDIDAYLLRWLDSPSRKPLVLRGARQVGKTHAVRELARQAGRELIEINLDFERDLHALFDLEPKRLFPELAALKGVGRSKDSLLFIDEIQAYPPALALLRYFHELMPNLPVIAAGSLLDFALRDVQFSMPVGRIEFAYMFPLSYGEFVRATEGDGLADLWLTLSPKNPSSSTVHNRLLRALRSYYFVGGMPEVVARYREDLSFAEAEKTQSSILQTFESDFLKYGKDHQRDLLRRVFRQLPGQIGKKLKYANLSADHRSTQVKSVIELLQLAGVCHLIHRSAGNGVPLGAEADENHFKAIFLDIGLVHHLLGLRSNQLSPLKEDFDLTTIMEGAMAEQFVGQELLVTHEHHEKKQLYYWHREARNSNAEIDYLESWGEEVIPCEVKAGRGSTLRSLHVFLREKKSTTAFRFWSDGFYRTPLPIGVQNKTLLSFPLYSAGQLFGRYAFHRPL